MAGARRGRLTHPGARPRASRGERRAKEFASKDGIFVIDDTTFPEQGKHSVGVPRQSCGALGKKANGRCAVSIHPTHYRPDS